MRNPSLTICIFARIITTYRNNAGWRSQMLTLIRFSIEIIAVGLFIAAVWAVGVSL